MGKQYETVIGLEVHVELATKTKLFCGCTATFGGKPNTHICPVCMGMPGSLPVLNKQVVEHAIAVGLAANCSITRVFKFDRKNYFYPDNPQNYQISQFYLPICRNGGIEIETQAGKKMIQIHELHIEEDAGKLFHEEETACSFIDFNRAGVPLIEIVSKPDMRSVDEVAAYLDKLKLMIQYVEASDCKMQEGSMRVDVNVSVCEVGAEVFGTRTEMKNLNSFKAIARAIEGERTRQIALLESGEKVVQETRRWDDTKECSYSVRSKEDVQDYRYFPEPDLVPFVIDDVWLEEIKRKQPELREEKMIRYAKEYNLPEYDILILTSSKQLANLFEQTVSFCHHPKKVSNWLMGETMRLRKEYDIELENLLFSPKNLAKLILLVEKKVINGTVSKEVFEKMFLEDIDPEKYVEENGRKVTTDEGELRIVVEKILLENSQSVKDYYSGKQKAFGFLVGQTMKAMKGTAEPDIIHQILMELL